MPTWTDPAPDHAEFVSQARKGCDDLMMILRTKPGFEYLAKMVGWIKGRVR